MGRSTLFFQPSAMMGSKAAGSTPARSGFPRWAILFKTAHVSEIRNATTAECDTDEGQAVEVTFWLVDPPGISYFSVHCPGLEKAYKASLVCAAANFVLVNVTFWGSTYYFIYTAGLEEKQSLRLLPHPDPAVFRGHQFGLLPRGDGEHYAVAFIDRNWTLEDDVWRFDAYVFSSETQSWKSSQASLSDSDKLLCAGHVFSKQITVGTSSLGWADPPHGILLLCNLFDRHPVIKFITFPVSSVGFTDEDASEYFCDVACCNDIIRFVEIKYDDPDFLTGGIGWEATMWVRKIPCDKWVKRSTVNVAEISVDQSYSALLPVLRDDETQKLQLKKLIFYAPILNMHNDDFLYMMAKVNDKDNKAWLMAIDMKRVALEALAPFSVKSSCHLFTMYRSCVFPEYINMSPGADMANPVGKCFKRMTAKRCVVQVLWTLDWLRELDQCLEIKRSTYNTCRLLLQLSPVSALRSNIRLMVEHASYNGLGEAGSKAVDFCLRALEDFDLALHESQSDRSASVEGMRRKISDVIQALDSVLQSVPSTLMPKERMAGEARHRKIGISIYDTCEKPSNSRGEKDQHNSGWVRRGGALIPGSWFLCFIGCLLISAIIVLSSPLM